MQLPTLSSLRSLSLSYPPRSSRFVYIGLGIFFLVLIGYALYEARGILAGPTIVISPRVLDTSNPLVKVSGTALRISSLSMNGKEIPVSESGIFEESYVLTEGYNRIVLNARDKYGKSTERAIEVMYDPMAPKVADTTTSSLPITATSSTNWVPLALLPNSGLYQEVDGVIVFTGNDGIPHTLSGATPDIASFAVSALIRIYARDNAHVYCRNNVLIGAEPESFVVLSGKRFPNSQFNSSFAKDANTVFERCGIIEGADPETFKTIRAANGTTTLYAVDKNVAFYSAEAGIIKMAEADLSTFKPIDPAQSCGVNCTFDAQDSGHKYYQGMAVE